MVVNLSNARPGFNVFASWDQVFALPQGHEPCEQAVRLFKLPENGPEGEAVEDLDGLLGCFFDAEGVQMSKRVLNALEFDADAFDVALEDLRAAWEQQVEAWA